MVNPQGGRLSGRFLDPDTLTPAKQVYVNEATGEVVEKVTGYPYGDGFVVLQDKEDLKSERDGRLELKSFIEPDQVDPLYFEKSHIVWPEKGNEDRLRPDLRRARRERPLPRGRRSFVTPRRSSSCATARAASWPTSAPTTPTSAG